MLKRAVMSFHHILSSKKIADLHGWSRELGLCGILKVGYPGVLVCAGPAVADIGKAGATTPDTPHPVDEYVRRIKRLRWQTCTLKLLGDLSAPPAGEEASRRWREGAAESMRALAKALNASAQVSPSQADQVDPGKQGGLFRGMLQVDHMKDITAVLRAADRLVEKSGLGGGGGGGGAATGAKGMGCWESFYSEAMRSP